MKLLIFSYYNLQDKNGGVKRIESLYKYLTNLGHSVKVVSHNTSLPISNGYFQFNDFYNSSYKYNIILYNIIILIKKVIRIASWYTTKPRFYFYDWYINVKKNFKNIYSEFRPDCILASYPPIESLILCILFSKFYNIPYFVDLRDPLIDESGEIYIIKKYKYIKLFYNNIENKIINDARAIFTVSPSMKDYYEKRGYNKVYLMPNGYDLSPTYNDANINKLDNNSVINIVHTGSISYFDKNRSIYPFLNAINKGLVDNYEIFKRLKVHLYGPITKKEKLKYKIKYNKLIKYGCLKIEGLKTFEESIDAQKKSDILLLIAGKNRKCVATSKIFEYLISGKPIIALAKNNYAEEIIINSRTGIALDPENESEIYNELKKILKSNTIFYEPDLEYIDRFNREKINKEIIEVMERNI